MWIIFNWKWKKQYQYEKKSHARHNFSQTRMVRIANNMENCEFKVPSSKFEHKFADLNLKISSFYSKRVEILFMIRTTSYKDYWFPTELLRKFIVTVFDISRTKKFYLIFTIQLASRALWFLAVQKIFQNY